MQQSFWQFMSHGGYAMWLIAAFSIIAVGIAVERWIVGWKFTSRARALGELVQNALRRRAFAEAAAVCAQTNSAMANVFVVGLGRRVEGREHRASAVHRERLRVMTTQRKRLWLLGTLGATAPFVGLFGTVIGIMEAMAELKGDITLQDVAGPISSALIVTAAGILVAVECVFLFNFFSQRAGAAAAESKLLTDEFLEELAEVDARTAAVETTGTTTNGEAIGATT